MKCIILNNILREREREREGAFQNLLFFNNDTFIHL